MSMRRHRNVAWALPTSTTGGIESWEYVKIAVLMDIRDELQNLNRQLNCPNFTQIPTVLRGIRAKIPAQRSKRK